MKALLTAEFRNEVSNFHLPEIGSPKRPKDARASSETITRRRISMSHAGSIWVPIFVRTHSSLSFVNSSFSDAWSIERRLDAVIGGEGDSFGPIRDESKQSLHIQPMSSECDFGTGGKREWELGMNNAQI
jgi:hypothetical protein